MAQFGVNRVYQDFEPFFEWNEDTVSVTLTIMLPGFRRDQLKVQVTSAPLLRINGEREVTLNIWRRFSKEFSIPTYCDTNEVTAKFERGMLHVKFPKIVNPNPNPNPQQQQEQSKTEQQQQQRGGENVAPPPIPQQSQEVNSNNNDQQISQQKEKEKEREREEPVSEEKTEKKTEAEHKNDELPKTGEENGATKEVDKERNESERVKGKETEPENGIAESKKVDERKRGSRIAQRLKTRVLDFSLSVNDNDDDDGVGKGYVGNLVRGVKRPKMMVNLVVAILLLVMVFGTYLMKKSLWSSSESEGGSSEFNEF